MRCLCCALSLALCSVFTGTGMAGPLDAENLRFATGSTTSLLWDAASAADSYAIYVGTIHGTGFGSYNHRCMATEVLGTSGEALALPSLGQAHYLLVTGLEKDPLSGEVAPGSLGQDSRGLERPDGLYLSCGRRTYVDPNATGAGTGESWTDAYTHLGDAFDSHSDETRSLEIWIHGTVSGGTTIPEWGPGAHLLGGFAGTETDQWQRSPELFPTVLDGSGAAVLNAPYLAQSLRLDGLGLENGTEGLYSLRVCDILVEIHDCQLQTLTYNSIQFGGTNQDCSGGFLHVTDSRFLGPVQDAISASIFENTGRQVRIERNYFEAASQAIYLYAHADNGSAELRAWISGNTIIGGEHAIRLSAFTFVFDSPATITGTIGSNVIFDSSDDAILLEALDWTDPDGNSGVVLNSTAITGNTFGGGQASAIALRVEYNTPRDPSREVRCEPQIWDNLITFYDEYAIREAIGDPSLGVFADAAAVGNDLYGNVGYYLDDGTTLLNSIEEVNALPACYDNYDENPRYVDGLAGDFHILAGSPAIDRGHPASIGMADVDIDGQPRTIDGNGDGSARPDTGADERVP